MGATTPPQRWWSLRHRSECCQGRERAPGSLSVTRASGSTRSRAARVGGVKKIPIERTWAEIWKVELIPPPAPRSRAGRLFRMAARLGAARAPIGSGQVVQAQTSLSSDPFTVEVYAVASW